jgi:hypothetical protein
MQVSGMKRADRKTRLRISLAFLIGALPIYLWVSLGVGLRLGWSPVLVALVAILIVAIACAIFLFLPPPRDDFF